MSVTEQSRHRGYRADPPAIPVGAAAITAHAVDGARLGRVLLTDGSVAVAVPLGPGDLSELLALHQRRADQDRFLRFATVHLADLVGHLTRWLAPGSGVLSLGARVRGQLVGAVHLYPLGGQARRGGRGRRSRLARPRGGHSPARGVGRRGAAHGGAVSGG